MSSVPELSDLLTRDQERQMEILLVELMAYGFGSLEIKIVEHQPRFLKYVRSIRASPCSEQLETQQDLTENATRKLPGAARKAQGGR